MKKAEATHIRLTSGVRIIPDNKRALVVSGQGISSLEGADVALFLARILPLLTCGCSKSGIADAVPDFSHRSVLAVLELLEQKGVLEEVPTTNVHSTELSFQETHATAENIQPPEETDKYLTQHERDERFWAATSPEMLRKQMVGWVDEQTGVVQAVILGTADGTKTGLPVCCTAIMPAYTDEHGQSHLPEHGFGKGLTVVEAMLSALGEAIERYSAGRYQKDRLYRSSYNNLCGGGFDPRHLCLYEDWQYDLPHFPFTRFDPDQAIDWVRGHWLDNGSAVWLPALPTFLNIVVPPEELFCQGTSNGLAAGKDLEDAARRAVYELIERDTFMMTWLCQKPAQRLLLDDALDTGYHEVIRQLAERGADVQCYLLSSDFPITTVLCVSRGNGRDWPGATIGLAAHMNPHIAARKAILELGQCGPYIRRLMLNGERPIPASPEDILTLIDHALYYIPADRAQAFNFLAATHRAPIALSELAEQANISWHDCIERLVASGIRIAIADVTAPDVTKSPFRVVRALGTNLQQIYAGFLLSRLANPRLQHALTQPINPNPPPLF